MIYDLLYESCIWHTRVALFDPQGRLVSVHYDDVMRPFLEGAVVLGRVRRIVKGLDAAFVDIGDTLDGFLPLKTLPPEIPALTEGQEVMVRVVRAPVEEKGAKLDARVLTRHPEGPVRVPSIITPPAAAISRTLMDAGDNPVRVWVVDGRFRQEVLQYVNENNLFELNKHPDVDLLEQLDVQIEQAAGPVFQMAEGGRLTVEMTRAVTVIDVDSGSMSDSSKMSRLAVNKHAVDEIFRLCTMLELGGSMIIDFLDLSARNQRDELEAYLRERFEYDLVDHEIMPMSRSGLVEIVRKRVGENLMVRLKWPMYVAGDIGLKLWRRPPSRGKIKVEASADVAAILKERLTYDQALAYLGVPVEVIEKAGLPVDGYRILGSVA